MISLLRKLFISDSSTDNIENKLQIKSIPYTEFFWKNFKLSNINVSNEKEFMRLKAYYINRVVQYIFNIKEFNTLKISITLQYMTLLETGMGDNLHYSSYYIFKLRKYMKTSLIHTKFKYENIKYDFYSIKISKNNVEYGFDITTHNIYNFNKHCEYLQKKFLNIEDITFKIYDVTMNIYKYDKIYTKILNYINDNWENIINKDLHIEETIKPDILHIKNKIMHRLRKKNFLSDN
jgi:hypothetical protein